MDAAYPHRGKAMPKGRSKFFSGDCVRGKSANEHDATLMEVMTGFLGLVRQGAATKSAMDCLICEKASMI